MSGIATERYTGPAILLHWVVAVLIIANIAFALVVDALPEAWQRPDIDLHKSIGITVLGLAILRLLWRVTHRPPPMPHKPWENRLAHAVHWALYAVIFLLPLSGWLHDSAWKGAPQHPLKLFWVIPWFRFGALEHLDPAQKEQMHTQFFAVHEALAYVIYGLVALHIIGALKHQFIDKRPELQRMLP